MQREVLRAAGAAGAAGVGAGVGDGGARVLVRRVRSCWTQMMGAAAVRGVGMRAYQIQTMRDDRLRKREVGGG